MMVKRKQVEQMYLTWREPEAMILRRHQYSQNGEGCHTRSASRSHDIEEHGCWAVQEES